MIPLLECKESLLSQNDLHLEIQDKMHADQLVSQLFEAYNRLQTTDAELKNKSTETVSGFSRTVKAITFVGLAPTAGSIGLAIAPHTGIGFVGFLSTKLFRWKDPCHVIAYVIFCAVVPIIFVTSWPYWKIASYALEPLFTTPTGWIVLAISALFLCSAFAGHRVTKKTLQRLLTAEVASLNASHNAQIESIRRFEASY